MSDVFNRITDLSSQKRELLARLLKQRGLDAARLPIGPRSATGPAERMDGSAEEVRS